MDTKDIYCFIRCYEEKSINKAARQLFITPQGLSKIIQNLEDEFHTRLFDRTSKGIRPTESGDFFYQHCTDLLNKLEEVKTGMYRLQERGKKIKIAFSCGVLQVLPFYQIEDYKIRHPEWSILWEEATNEEVKNKMQKGEIDLAFTIGRISNPNLVEEAIFSTKMYAVIYEGHRLFTNKKIEIADLESEPLITLNDKYQCYYSLMQRCNDLGFVPDIVVKTVESSLIYRLCEAKAGIGIDVNIHRIQEEYPQLRYIEIEDTIPWEIYMVHNKQDENVDSIRQIMDFFRSIGNKK